MPTDKEQSGNEAHAEGAAKLLTAYERMCARMHMYLTGVVKSRGISPDVAKSIHRQTAQEGFRLLKQVVPLAGFSPEILEVLLARAKVDRLLEDSSTRIFPGLTLAQTIEMEARGKQYHCGECDACRILKKSARQVLASITPVFGTGNGDDAACVWNRALYDNPCTTISSYKMTTEELLKR